MSAPTLPALRDALDGRSVHGVDVVTGTRPTLLDAEAVRCATAPFLAAFMVAAAMLRAEINPDAFDLMALLLRAAAFAFTLRALILIGRLIHRTSKDLSATRHRLAFGAEGLVYLSPGGERSVRREDVLGIRVAEARGSRFLPEPRRRLFVITHPRSSTTHLELPPYFAATPDILAARLERAFGLSEGSPPRKADLPAPPGQAEERYARAAKGERLEGHIAIAEGSQYLLRGPYAVLLGDVFALDALRVAGPELRPALVMPVLVACALGVAVPLLWVLYMKRRSAARLGIAMLLTPEELLVRGRHGVVSVPWGQLERAEVVLRELWSPFVGTYTVRTLVIESSDGATIPFDGAFLGVAPEVVSGLCDAYAAGLVAS
jgi:hypothetical protein